MNLPAMSPEQLGVLVATATRPKRPLVSVRLVAGVGSTVETEDVATGRRATYRLVEAHEASPAEGLLSIASPVGLALNGRAPGDTATANTPRGPRSLRVVSVT